MPYSLFAKLIGRQLRKPSGLLGRMVADSMENSNRPYYGRVVELLELGGGEHILEVGCGSGLVIRQIMERHPSCRVDGLDFSRLMLARARRNNPRAIQEGRVRLIEDDLGAHEFAGRVYDRAFGINVVYFWEDLAGMLAKLHGLLAAGGRLVLLMSSPERLEQVPFAVDGVFNKYSLERAVEELKRAGFGQITHEAVDKRGQETYYICAEKSASD